MEKISVYDNFFDLGGHSLLMVQAHSRLQAAWKKDLPIIKLFKYPTINSLAKALGSDAGSQSTSQNIRQRAHARRESMGKLSGRRRRI